MSSEDQVREDHAQVWWPGGSRILQPTPQEIGALLGLIEQLEKEEIHSDVIVADQATS